MSYWASDTSLKDQRTTEQEKFDSHFAMEVQLGHLWIDKDVDENKW